MCRLYKAKPSAFPTGIPKLKSFLTFHVENADNIRNKKIISHNLFSPKYRNIEFHYFKLNFWTQKRFTFWIQRPRMGGCFFVGRSVGRLVTIFSYTHNQFVAGSPDRPQAAGFAGINAEKACQHMNKSEMENGIKNAFFSQNSKIWSRGFHVFCGFRVFDLATV